MRLSNVGMLAALYVLSPTIAAAERYGDWALETVPSGYIIASTENSNGSGLGKLCSIESEACLWVLLNKIGCKEGAEYPVLVNTTAGASDHTVRCMNSGENMMYAFTDYEKASVALLSEAVRTVGIAFPMEKGRFQANYFSMEGASEANAAVARRVRSLNGSQRGKNSSDRGDSEYSF